MRLRDLKSLLEKNAPYITINGEGANNGVFIKNASTLMESILNISELDFIKEDIIRIRDVSELYYSRTDKILVSQNKFSELTNIIESIKVKTNAVIRAINEAIPEQDEYSISVKLPKINNLAELASFAKDLDTALSQALINDKIDGKVELQNFDSGSLWLEVIVGGATALNFTAGLVWSACVIRKKIYEGSLMKEKLNGLKIRNESLTELNTALENEINVLSDVEARQLLSTNNIEGNPEFVKRLQYSIKTLAELIYKGTEIHHSLTAPEEVKNLFPDFKKIDFIDLKAKELTDGE